MDFSEFTLESAVRVLAVVVREAELFPSLTPVVVPDWLPGWLTRGTRLALISEKARSEFIVVPILLAARELSGDRLAIFSGQRLDVDGSRGLTGECDFLLSLGQGRVRVRRDPLRKLTRPMVFDDVIATTKPANPARSRQALGVLEELPREASQTRWNMNASLVKGDDGP